MKGPQRRKLPWYCGSKVSETAWWMCNLLQRHVMFRCGKFWYVTTWNALWCHVMYCVFHNFTDVQQCAVTPCLLIVEVLIIAICHFLTTFASYSPYLTPCLLFFFLPFTLLSYTPTNSAITFWSNHRPRKRFWTMPNQWYLTLSRVFYLLRLLSFSNIKDSKRNHNDRWSP